MIVVVVVLGSDKRASKSTTRTSTSTNWGRRRPLTLTLTLTLTMTLTLTLTIFPPLGQEASRDRRAESPLRESIGWEAGTPERRQFSQRPSADKICFGHDDFETNQVQCGQAK